MRRFGLLTSVCPEMRNFLQDHEMREFNPQGILYVFRGLKFEHDNEIGENNHFRTGTN